MDYGVMQYVTIYICWQFIYKYFNISYQDSSNKLLFRAAFITYRSSLSKYRGFDALH